MKKQSHLLTALALAALALAAPRLAAQEEEPPEEQGTDVEIHIGQVRAQVRLAFPQATLDGSLRPADQEIAREIEQTLRDDLEYSGVFNIQGPTELAVLTLTGDREHDFEQYQSLGNEVLLLATIKREDARMVLEGRLYDLPSRQSITGKRYRGEPEQARRIAHTLADAVYFQFTGRPGLALTTIAFQSDRDGANRQELYLMDYDGRNQRRISSHKSTSGFSDWSPTGDALAYMSYFTGSAGIYYVDIETSRKVPVYREGTLNLSPSFSPDGRQIAFAHASDVNVDVYVLREELPEPAAADHVAGHRHQPGVEPRRGEDRLHLRPLRQAQRLRDGPRRLEPAADLLRGRLQRRRLLAARRQPPRLRQPPRRLPLPDRRDQPGGLEDADAHQRLRQLRAALLFSRRPAHRLHRQARTRGPDPRDEDRRLRLAAAHPRGQQHGRRLVELCRAVTS